jgi:hypothetical protein
MVRASETIRLWCSRNLDLPTFFRLFALTIACSAAMRTEYSSTFQFEDSPVQHLIRNHLHCTPQSVKKRKLQNIYFPRPCVMCALKP